MDSTPKKMAALLQTADFAGTKAVIEIIVYSVPQYKTIISMNWLGDCYTFEITKWSGTGFAPALGRFFKQYPDSPFGKLDDIGTHLGTVDDKLNIVRQMSYDVVKCIGQIYLQFRSGIRGYALYYREKVSRSLDDDYVNFITLIACHCIVHSDFHGDKIQYPIIQFSP